MIVFGILFAKKAKGCSIPKSGEFARTHKEHFPKSVYDGEVSW